MGKMLNKHRGQGQPQAQPKSAPLNVEQEEEQVEVESAQPAPQLTGFRKALGSMRDKMRARRMV